MALQEQIDKLREAGPRTGRFLGEVRDELKKVHWPTQKETYAATVVVIVVLIVMAVFLGLVDLAISHVLQAFLN